MHAIPLYTCILNTLYKSDIHRYTGFNLVDQTTSIMSAIGNSSHAD